MVYLVNYYLHDAPFDKYVDFYNENIWGHFEKSWSFFATSKQFMPSAFLISTDADIDMIKATFSRLLGANDKVFVFNVTNLKFDDCRVYPIRETYEKIPGDFENLKEFFEV